MRTILVLAFTTIAYAQPGAPTPPLVACGTAEAGTEVLCGARAPEDLELTPDGKALLVAQYTNFRNANDRAGIALLDLATKKYSPVAITAAPDKTWGDPACPGPITGDLAAHGSSLVKRKNGAWQYFAVNHAGRQSIEMYELKQTSGAWGLIWHGCVVSEKDFNDVAALSDGGFVATHPTAMQVAGQPIDNLFDGHPSGWVARWTPGKGEAELPGTRFGYPNGVVVSADARYAYYASWTAKEIHKYDLREAKEISVTKLEFMPDNLTWTSGKAPHLLAAGVKSARGNCPASSTTPCTLSFGVAQLDPATMKIEKTIDNGGRPLISGVSVALQVGPAIYVGAFQGDRLVKVDWKQ